MQFTAIFTCPISNVWMNEYVYARAKFFLVLFIVTWVWNLSFGFKVCMKQIFAGMQRDTSRM